MVKNSFCQEDAALLDISAENAENGEKQQNVATPLLFDPSEQASYVFNLETKYQS